MQQQQSDRKSIPFSLWLAIGLAIIVSLLFTSLLGDTVFFEIGSTNNMTFILALGVTVIVGLLLMLQRSIRQNKQLKAECSEKCVGSVALAAQLESHKKGIDEHAIVSITDPKGRILYVNDKFCKISKYSQEELIGKDHRILNSGHHDTAFFAAMYQAIKNGESWSGDIRNRAKDGSYYWVSTTVAPVIDEFGDLKEIISIRTDISVIKQQKAELTNNNRILNSLFENFPGGICMADKDFFVQNTNTAFYQFLDLPEEQFPIGCNFKDILRYNVRRGEYGDVDETAYIANRIQMAANNEPVQFSRTTQTGRVLDIRVWSLEGGGFVAAHLDITEHDRMIKDLEARRTEAEAAAEQLKLAREAQEKSHSHLLDSIDSMKNGFAIWDRSGRLVMANETFNHFFSGMSDEIRPGMRVEEILEKGLDSDVWLLGGGDSKQWLRSLMALFARNGEAERAIIKKDGTHLVLHCKRLENNDVISSVFDLTVERQREAELLETRDALTHLAYFDTLTGLPNRASCQMELEKLFSSPCENCKFSIIQIDLDKFKRVNDTLGHASGDVLLREVGNRLAFLAEKVSGFSAYRWGGDEFIAVFEYTDIVEVEDLCQEMTDLIAVPVAFEDKTLWPTASLGVSIYPDDATDLVSLMGCADMALYKTKELGRDGFQFFKREMRVKLEAETSIELDLRRALKADEIELFYQPQVNTSDETLSGIEALVRWRHPERGLLPPGIFLETAESSGMAPLLGSILFDKAMADARHWLDEGLEFGRLSLNLSPAHLKKQTLVQDFCDSMQKHGVEPKYLAVELLESMLVDDQAFDASGVFEQLAAKGVHVELDDFGTGYASLSHLTTLPIDGIKIDRSFVNEIVFNNKQQAIVEVVMSMSKLMKLRVVCEGIESHQQLAAVSKLANCAVQGYLVSRPMSFDAMTDWMKNQSNHGILTHRMQPSFDLARTKSSITSIHK